MVRWVVVGVAWVLGFVPVAQAQFSTSDLAGTWSVFGRFDNPSFSAPGETRGTVMLDATGAFTGGSLSPLGKPTETVTGGALSVTPGGVVSGTLNTTGGPIILADFQLAPSGDVLAGTETDGDGVVTILTWVRHSGSFSEADFAGDWYIFTHFDERLAPNNPGWTRVQVTLNSSGTVINTISAVESDGAGEPLDGLDLDIDLGGIATISFPPLLTDATLQMTSDKQLVFGTIHSTEDAGSTPNFVVAVRLGTIATNADLAGTWTHYSFSDNAAQNGPLWSRSVFTLDATGNAIDGFKTDSLGGSQPLSGGSLSVDAAGRVDGSLTFGSLATDRFEDAKMNASADLFAGVASGAGGADDRRILSIVVLPEPGVLVTALSALLSLATFGIWARRSRPASVPRARCRMKPTRVAGRFYVLGQDPASGAPAG